MTIFDVLSLLCGLALFLYGMDVMGDALKKSAGNQLKSILGKMTSNQFKGFMLGLGVTMIIQSSSATTVMVVGFVNSATMTLTQAIGVIMGANVGTAVTAWLTALNGIEGGADATAWLAWLKPDAWMPILALIGICCIMFSKKSKYKPHQSYRRVYHDFIDTVEDENGNMDKTLTIPIPVEIKDEIIDF